MTRVSARIDDDLATAIENTDYGSKSDAVRIGLRKQYLGGSQEDTRTDGGLPESFDLSPAARQGYRALVDCYGTDQMMEIGTIEATIASETNTPKTAVRRQIVKPLVRSGLASVIQRTTCVLIELHGVDR